ncbi:MAG: glycosyltransferase, partial [Patescibacteria group bacterium]
MKISIQIVTWNSRKFLSECLNSIFNQTYKDFSILIIDNASNDGTIEFIKENYPTLNILRNSKNLGFATAHNQGLRLFENSPYVLLINPDVILEKDWLEKILSVIEKD